MEPLAWYRLAAPALFVAGLGAVCLVRPGLARFRALLLGVGMLTGYAMAQDQVSARLCPEYFTALHPPIPGVSHPTLLGILWGFLGAWWGGALLGYAAGVAATAGPRPSLGVGELVRPMLCLVAVVGAVAGLTGLTVARHAEMFGVMLDPGVSAAVPPERHRAVFVVACYHFATYVTAAVGSVVLCVWVARERKRRAETRLRCPAL